MPTSATLTGPTSGQCDTPSSNFRVDLDAPAGGGGVMVTISSTVGGDTITPDAAFPINPIPAGNTAGFFTLTPSTLGARNISISTTPALTISGSPITYTATGNCPDDTGGVSRTQNWTPGAFVCPPGFSLVFVVTPSTLEAKDFYCTTSSLALMFTE
jgi:hypothetical protein